MDINSGLPLAVDSLTGGKWNPFLSVCCHHFSPQRQRCLLTLYIKNGPRSFRQRAILAVDHRGAK